ncbi:MAG: hypothetical protein M3042_05125 [Actinomycetota bacterium]|nr:hypothetical protein [Actinomycetota bacterium]
MSQAGRHRLGPYPRRPCRDIPQVLARLQAGELTRHVNRHGAWRVRPSIAVGAGLLAALAGGWLTAGQAVAAQLSSR